MEKLTDGYVPMDHRELRFSFRPPRDLLDPDLSNGATQLARGDRQILQQAKKVEDPNSRRVWGYLSIPIIGGGKKGKSETYCDILIATPYGLMVIKVLPWNGDCITTPGQKWIETRSDGSKIEHENQFAELDETTQWVRTYLESKQVVPKIITSYILFPSPRCNPSFTNDPRMIIGPANCAALVVSNGIHSELAKDQSYLEWGKGALNIIVNKVRKQEEEEEVKGDGKQQNLNENNTFWKKFQSSFDVLPQFDVLYLRKNGCYLFGHVERFEDDPEERQGSARSLERMCNRHVLRVFRFEHSKSGLIGAPIALVTGGLGWEPMTRARAILHQVDIVGSSKTIPPLSSVDIPPTTRIVFRVYGCEGLITPHVNDVDILELAKFPAKFETGPAVLDQIQEVIGGVLTKSLQVGVKSMLPFPFNNLI